MACFLVPATEAVVATVVTKSMELKDGSAPASASSHEAAVSEKLPFTRKLKWLTNLLWGGSALLAFEHVWHGEVVPWFPFLTAASDPADAAEMLHEMATAGVMMAVLVTVIWLVMLGISAIIEKRPAPLPEEK